MTEGLRLAVRHAFRTLKLHRVEAGIQPENIASLGVVKKLGFRYEGTALRLLEINGKWSDHERWAMTVEEWRDINTPRTTKPRSPAIMPTPRPRR
jgi:ribosomal-protein-alanine N-acetyltransferase